MEHYICAGGCKGESETQGVCQAPGCAKHGQDLQRCGCEDGRHFGEFDFKNHNHDETLPQEKE